MRKLAITSFIYLIIGLSAGVYYREITKITDFTGQTQLSIVHTHSLLLGMFFFLLVLLLENNFQLSQQSAFKRFYLFYNSGLALTLLMMLLHGTLVVLGGTGNPAIAGIAGLGHILLTIGFIFFAISLWKQLPKQATTSI